jgi:F-type H+-transporting ATPase subunit b
MLIDWFTVIAQVVNFLILVWLLKRFLYQPILNAIDAREQRIAAELADADAKRVEAQNERTKLVHKNDEFNKQRAILLSKVMDEVKLERQRLLVEAQKDANDLSDKWKDSLRREKVNLSEKITTQIQQEVFSITRKALTDLASINLEEHIVEVFIRRMHELNSEEKGRMKVLFHPSDKIILVRTAFKLSKEQKVAIEDTVTAIAGIKTQVQFETVPNLVSGIELTLNGQKLAWSLDDYLKSLEHVVEEFFKEESKVEPNP